MVSCLQELITHVLKPWKVVPYLKPRAMRAMRAMRAIAYLSAGSGAVSLFLQSLGCCPSGPD